MKIRPLLFHITVSMMYVLSACTKGNDANTDKPYTPIQLTEDAGKISEKSNRFGMNLFSTISAKEENDAANICVSPYSVFTVMSMVANGGSSSVQESFLNFFGLGCDDIEAINDYNSTLIEQLPTIDNRTIFHVANGIWYNPQLTFNQALGKKLQDYYSAILFDQSPAGTKGMESINNWVSENTQGLIKEAINSPKDWDVAFVNTVYFKGKWKEEFKISDTKPRTFHNIDGSDSQTDFMHISADLYFNDIDNFFVVELPYGNKNFAMYAILPFENVNFHDFIANINPSSFDNLSSKLLPATVNLAIPKFETYFNEDHLLPILKDMGFSNPILDRIFGEPIELKDILHGVRITVDEEGTEAAASTIADGDVIAPGPIIDLTFDRPFIYMIRETSTGTILFMGQQVRF